MKVPKPATRPSEAQLAFCASLGAVTDPGRQAGLFAGLPKELPALTALFVSNPVAPGIFEGWLQWI